MNKIEIVSYNDKIIYCEYASDELVTFKICKGESISVGDIYIGKVKSISKNINAAFVEVTQGVMGYLPLDNSEAASSLKVADEVAVQVISEAVKSKEMKLTCELSISGKYVVVTAGKSGIGYSKKLSKEFKENFIINNVEDNGVIIRTNAGSVLDVSVIQEEVDLLSAELKAIEQNKSMRKCYTCIRKALPDYINYLKESKLENCDIRVDDEIIYNEVVDFYSGNEVNLLLYRDEYPLYKLLSISKRFEELTNKKVWLKSGGNIIIEPTEALTVIDVNSSKITNKKSKEENIYMVNKEAAIEVMRQVRLRNISGIIIVDFINMVNEYNRADIIRILKAEAKKDDVNVRVQGYTNLGLVEFTRKKTYKSIYESKVAIELHNNLKDRRQ